MRARSLQACTIHCLQICTVTAFHSGYKGFGEFIPDKCFDERSVSDVAVRFETAVWIVFREHKDRRVDNLIGNHVVKQQFDLRSTVAPLASQICSKAPAIPVEDVHNVIFLPCICAIAGRQIDKGGFVICFALIRRCIRYLFYTPPLAFRHLLRISGGRFTESYIPCEVFTVASIDLCSLSVVLCPGCSAGPFFCFRRTVPLGLRTVSNPPGRPAVLHAAGSRHTA